LAEAGWAAGSLHLASNITNGMHKSTAEVVQQNLGDIGIRCNSRCHWANFLYIANRGQYEFAVNGTALDNNDPDSLTSLLDGSLSSSFARSSGLATPS